MKTNSAIDNAGRIVIPKALRQRYGLEPGQAVRFISHPEGITIAPDHPERKFIRRGPLLTIDTGDGPAPLEVFDIQRLRDDHLDAKNDENRR
jgi:AbrB family looped-hinge helix DNA binding protein